MKRYEMKLRAVIAWCHSCEWSVLDFAMLFRHIQLVIEYYYRTRHQPNVFARATLQESHDAAFLELAEFMRARCMPDEVRECVWWLVSDHKKRIDARV